MSSPASWPTTRTGCSTPTPCSSQGYGTLFHGTKASIALFVDRDVQARSAASSNNSNLAHWENFLECVRTRQRPVSDIEIGFRSTATCLLGNVALRSKLRIDWDEANGTTAQPEARRWLSAPYRSPWKLEV
jgi:hypothetical protein